MYRVHTTRREPLGIEPEIADDVAGEPDGVGLVVDRELAWIAEHVAVRPQDADARGVERRHPHRADDRADEVRHTFTHLGGGLVGERDGQDLRRLDTLVDEVGDAMREHARLARAGSGHHEQRAGLVHDRVELVGVEALRERRRPSSALAERALVGVVEIQLPRRIGVGAVGGMRDVGEQLVVGHDTVHSTEGL